MAPALFVVAAVLLVGVGGLFAAADAALAVLSRQDLVELAVEARAKRSLLAIAEDPGAHVTAINFIRVLFETAAAVLVTIAAWLAFGQWWLVLLVAGGVMTAVSFVLVGSSPRSVGRAHARGLVRVAAPLIRAVRVLLGPIPSGLVRLGDAVTPGRGDTLAFANEEQLLSMVDDAAEAEVLEEEDRELIHSIFEWGDTLVREVMVPRTDMGAIDGDTPASEAMARFFETGFSRMPVLGRDADDVHGVLYLRDLARLLAERSDGLDGLDAAELSRPAVFVPESKKADDTLREMQASANHLAMVVDEYGGIAGLVTMEDLIEELVGDISDEYDRAAPEVTALGNGSYLVAATLPIDELGELFGIELDDEDVDSVGGLLTKALGRLPEHGSSATVSGLRLRAERVDGRRGRLRTVLVEADAALAAAEDAFVPRRDDDGKDASRETGETGSKAAKKKTASKAASKTLKKTAKERSR